MKSGFFLVISAILICNLLGQSNKKEYLGLKVPGMESELFAPGIITTYLSERDLAISPDGDEIYFCINSSDQKYGTIFVTKYISGKWQNPVVMEHMNNPDNINLEPHISPDGKKFYFFSNRPIEGDTTDQTGGADIWVMDREGENWSEPYNLGYPINTEHKEFFPSVTKDGTIYFTRAEKNSRIHNIYRSKMIDGKYSEPELLPKEVNSGRSQFNALISPDEDFIIVPTAGRTDTHGFTDYYISYRNEDDSWEGPYNLGEKINSENWLEYSPSLSPDGKYFFFISGKRNLPNTKKLTYKDILNYNQNPANGNTDIYWISSKVLNRNYVIGDKNEK